MMLLWISCLLIGSITSSPIQKDVTSSTGPGSYSSPNMAEGMVFDSSYAVFSPEVSEYGVAYAASQASGYDGSASDGRYSGGYGSSAGAYEGDSSYGFVAPSQDENWSSVSATGYGAENPEPVFSDVSDLEPVYSFSSRSRYQRGRAVFAQTRYTPGEPVFPPMPVARRYSKTTLKESSPADAPTKGGF